MVLQAQVKDAFAELLRAANIERGELFVLGCSTSAVAGFDIGKNSSLDIANTLMSAILPIMRENGLYLCVQCCEHLNRAIVIEKEAAKKFGFSEVLVRPWLHAGGAMALTALETLDNAIVVEDIKSLAAAGADIGSTFIGMHLRPVVVPIHSTHKLIGEAVLTMARTRPKYIGGPRAQYMDTAAH